jgi:hypothetical protein
MGQDAGGIGAGKQALGPSLLLLLPPLLLLLILLLLLLQVIDVWEPVTESDVQTPLEVYKELQEDGYDVVSSRQTQCSCCAVKQPPVPLLRPSALHKHHQRLLLLVPDHVEKRHQQLQQGGVVWGRGSRG